jgi:hypothetical protein
MLLVPSIFISRKSESSILAKFQALQLHKWRKPIEVIAKELQPIVRGIINYYGKFSIGHLRRIGNQLNARLIKWVKWEKGLYKMECIKWLRNKYKANPLLFEHWKLVNP